MFNVLSKDLNISLVFIALTIKTEKTKAGLEKITQSSQGTVGTAPMH